MILGLQELTAEHKRYRAALEQIANADMHKKYTLEQFRAVKDMVEIAKNALSTPQKIAYDIKAIDPDERQLLAES